jgi:chromosome segregation ATPase
MLSLYVEDDLIQLAKSQKINISRLVNEILTTEFSIKNVDDAITKEEIINKLKIRVSNLSDELKISIEKYKLFEKEKENLNNQIKELKTEIKTLKECDGEVIAWD